MQYQSVWAVGCLSILRTGWWKPATVADPCCAALQCLLEQDRLGLCVESCPPTLHSSPGPHSSVLSLFGSSSLCLYFSWLFFSITLNL